MAAHFCLQVSASSESMYDDAYTLQMVEKEDVANFNFVAGMVPFLFNLIQDVRLRLYIFIAQSVHLVLEIRWLMIT